MEPAIVITLAIFGTSVTGFLFLSLWIRNINKDFGQEIEDLKLGMKDHVTHKWLETKFEVDMRKEFEKLEDSMEKLNESIMGTTERKGMLTMLHSHEDRLDKSEKRYDKRQGDTG